MFEELNKLEKTLEENEEVDLFKVIAKINYGPDDPELNELYESDCHQRDRDMNLTI